MSKLVDVKYGFGRVQFFNEVEPVPATSKTEGNVTIKNAGSPGLPSYFNGGFILACKFEDDGVEFSNVMNWDVVVTGRAKDSPYSEIEAECARQLAPMFRELASAIEKQVAEYDSGEKTKKG